MSFKFDKLGVVKPFEGNTLLCHIPQETIFFNKILNFYRYAKRLSFYDKITLLPTSSYHVTIMNCCHQHNKELGFWPNGLSPSSSIAECNSMLENIFTSNMFYFEDPIRLKVTQDPNLVERPRSVNVVLEPVDQKHADMIRALRQQISTKTGLTDPSHDSIKFHITLAYINEELCETEILELHQTLKNLHDDLKIHSPVLSLKTPEFTHFEDMFYFRKICSLNNSTSQ